MTAPTNSFGTMIEAFTYGSSTASTSRGNSAGLCTSRPSPSRSCTRKATVGAARDRGERVADAQARDVLQPRHHVPDLPGGERVDRRHRRREKSELLGLEPRSRGHREQRLAARERAVDDADEGDDAAVLVV